MADYSWLCGVHGGVGGCTNFGTGGYGGDGSANVDYLAKYMANAINEIKTGGTLIIKNNIENSIVNGSTNNNQQAASNNATTATPNYTGETASIDNACGDISEKGYLLFNGKKLSIIDGNGNKYYTVDAVSGEPDKNGHFDYTDKNQWTNHGPVPEGVYYIDILQIQHISFLDDFLGFYGRGGWSGGSWEWGHERVFINPNEVTKNGITRSGMAIHGSYDGPGSWGCIDLMRNERKFFNKLENYSIHNSYQTIYELIVKY